MLIEPGCYFAGAYPALEIMIAKFGETPSRAEVKKKPNTYQLSMF